MKTIISDHQKTITQTGFKKIIVLLFAALVNMQFLNARSPDLYLIEVSVDPAEAVIEGTVTLRYTNPLDRPVNIIPLRIKSPVNYFHHDIIINQVTDNKNNLIELMPDTASDFIYNVVLLRELAAGDEKELVISFTSNLLYHYDYYLTNGLWHPKAVVYREDDFYASEEQADNFEVAISVPGDYSVLSSGKVAGKNTENGITHLYLTAEDITGFGFVVFDHLATGELNSNNVQISVAYPKEMEEEYLRLLHTSSEVIDFYINTFGFYPQPVLVILPGSATSTGGFPLASNMVVLHKPRLDHEPFAKWIMAHEIGHQLWGFDYLIDSGKYGRWLGLGLGIWADRLYNQSMNNEGLYLISNFFDRYMEGVRKGYNTTLMQDYNQLGKLGFDWNNVISHGKGYTVVYLLEQVIGEEQFMELSRHLLKNYRNQYLSIKDFQKAAERISRSDLNWFFNDWVYSGKNLEYRVDSVIIKDNHFEIHVARGNGARLPLNIDIVLENGEELTVPADIGPDNQILIVENDLAPMHVRIDNRFNRLLVDQKRGYWMGDYSGLHILDLEIPELAWNINRLKFKITNTGSTTREALIHIQTQTVDVNFGGFGRSLAHKIKPGDTVYLEREMAFKPVPGKQRGTITIRDAGIDHVIYRKTVETIFPHVNQRINPFITNDFTFAVKGEYPAFQYQHHNNLVVYYLPDDNYVSANISAIICERTGAMMHLANTIDPEFSDTVAIFLFPDEPTKIEFTFHQGMGAALPNNTIYEVYNEAEKLDIYHELVHLISAGIGNPPAMFNEGHAVYHHKNQLWDSLHFDSWAVNYKRNNQLIPLRELITFREIGSPESRPSIAYPQSASIVGYLISRFGYDRFLEAYRQINMEDITAGTGLIDEKLREIFGLGIDEIETGWLSYLSDHDASSASPSFSSPRLSAHTISSKQVQSKGPIQHTKCNTTA